MAKAAGIAEKRLDLLLDSSWEAYEELPEVAAEIKDWNDGERMGYVYDWFFHIVKIGRDFHVFRRLLLLSKAQTIWVRGPRRLPGGHSLENSHMPGDHSIGRDAWLA